MQIFFSLLLLFFLKFKLNRFHFVCLFQFIRTRTARTHTKYFVEKIRFEKSKIRNRIQNCVLFNFDPKKDAFVQSLQYFCIFFLDVQFKIALICLSICCQKISESKGKFSIVCLFVCLFLFLRIHEIASINKIMSHCLFYSTTTPSSPLLNMII